MILLNNILYLTMPELTQAGISYCTAKKWSFKIKNPDDSRCDLFPFEQIKPKYQALITECFGDVYEFQTAELIQQYLKPDQKAFNWFSTYELENKKGLPPEHIEKYIKAAQWLNMFVDMMAVTTGFKKIYGMSRADFWERSIKVIKSKKIDLPGSYKRLTEKIRKYQVNSYAAIVSDRFDHANNQIITFEAGEWLIARYSSMVDKCHVDDLWYEYNKKAISNGWKQLESEKTIYNFLNRPDVMYRWYAGRYGELEFKKKFGIKQARELPMWRDALWFSDGTKVNYYYKGAKGMGAKLNVYEVIDAYSECLLGCYFSFSEDHEAQYHAYKNAIMFAGARPYETRYDNQGGHKKLVSGDFLKKIAKISHVTQPYNGNSKTIENVFYRFQNKFLYKEWYFTGQNVTSKKLESRANMEFIIANQKDLPSLEDVKKQYMVRREEWNNALHPKLKIPRIEAYLNSQNPEHYAVDLLEMVEMFWITSADSLTYYAEGIKPTIKGKEYHFEVLSNGLPDLSFVRRYVGQKFYYKYDPAELTHIRLYIKGPSGLQFVSEALPKVTTQTAVQCQKDGDMQHINKFQELANKQRIENHQDLVNTQAEHGQKAEQHDLKTPKLRGVNQGKAAKKKPATVKKAKKRPTAAVTVDIGEFHKEMANRTFNPEDHFFKD